MEQTLTYDEMQAKTGFTIRYLPRENGAVELHAESAGAAIAASIAPGRTEEAHILWMEATELLRSRNKIGQTHEQIRAALEVLFAMFRGEKVSAERIAAVNVPRVSSPSSAPVDKPIDVDGTMYHRLLVKTRFVSLEDKDILPIIEQYAAPHLRPGDTLYVSEKALTITQGGVLDIGDIEPSWLARLFARNVSNNYGTADFKGFGHGTPLAMQLLIEEAGYARAIAAALISALTRPLGIRGLFYAICGTQAKSVDLPMSFLILEYAHAAKLAPKDPTGEAKRFKAALGCEAVILDSNYRGAFSLGKSTRAISEEFIGKVFRDNPMGQSDEMTPFCIVRK
jgi:hypothetical protein